jgi:hypothetical protein
VAIGRPTVIIWLHKAGEGQMTTARKLAVGGLIAATAGIIVQILGGAKYPTVTALVRRRLQRFATLSALPILVQRSLP